MFQRIVEYLRTFRERGNLASVMVRNRKDGSRNADAHLLALGLGVLGTRPIFFYGAR